MPPSPEYLAAPTPAAKVGPQHRSKASHRKLSGNGYTSQMAALSPQNAAPNANPHSVFGGASYDPALWAKVSEVAATQTQKISERVAFESQRLHAVAAQEKAAINQLAANETSRASAMQQATGSGASTGTSVTSLIQQQAATACGTIQQHLAKAVGAMTKHQGSLHAPQKLGDPNFAMQTVARAGLDVRQEIANCGLMARAEIEFDAHTAKEQMNHLGNQAQRHLTESNAHGHNYQPPNMVDDEYADQPWRRPSRNAQIAQFERDRLKNEFGVDVPALGADADSDLTRVLWFDQMVRDKKIDPTMAEEMMIMGAPSTGAYFSQVAAETKAKKKQRRNRIRNLLGSAIIGAITGGAGSALMAAMTNTGAALSAAKAAWASYSFTQSALSSALSTWAIKYTGAGRKLSEKVSHEIFDDILGLDPETARLVGGFAMSIAGGKLINSGLSKLAGGGMANAQGDVSMKSLQNNSIFTGESYQVASNGTIPASPAQVCAADVAQNMNQAGFPSESFFPAQVRALLKKCKFEPGSGKVTAQLSKPVEVAFGEGSNQTAVLFEKKVELTIQGGKLLELRGIKAIENNAYLINIHSLGNGIFNIEGGKCVFSKCVVLGNQELDLNS